jgi:tRNA pseudouridine38-40 synthase
MQALGELGGGEVKVVGAGRTDAGVHATGQVASALIDTDLSADVLCNALNARLPLDVHIRRSEEVPIAFNARFDAKKRTYQYYFIRRPTALWRGRFYHIRGDFDTGAMRKALHALLGDQDFTSFALSADTDKTNLCNIMQAELNDVPPILTLTITADRFLHNMVRAIAGTILEIGRGKSLEINEVIAARDRSAAGPNLPPHALYLVRVAY